MHPIERLRSVARSAGADQELLVQEAAGALAALGQDPAGLVTACRRLLDRHPVCGPLWWLAARVLTAADPADAAWSAVEEIDRDATVVELAHALPDGATVTVLGWPVRAAAALARRGDLDVLVLDVHGRGSGLVRRLLNAEGDATDVPVEGLGAAVAASDLVVLEASAVGPTGLVAVASSRAAATVAARAGTAVWAVGGVGRLLPARMWGALRGRLEAAGEAWDNDDEVVPIELVDRLAGPAGVEPVHEGLGRTDCPVAPELLRAVRPL